MSAATTAPTTNPSHDGITHAHWSWVQQLIEDVRAHVDREDTDMQALRVEWMLAERQFRRAEFAHLRDPDAPPGCELLAWHRSTLEQLLAVGDYLLQHDPLPATTARVQGLRLNWEEFHSPRPPLNDEEQARILELRARMLGDHGAA